MSQQEASNFCKVEGINVISSILYDVILDMTSALSLWRVKVINELVAKNDENRTKPGNGSTQQNNDDTNITTSTYKHVVPFPQCLKNKKVNISYFEILYVFK